jgi:ubiquinone/menaquinone biosynthesis C-methylase UbiE
VFPDRYERFALSTLAAVDVLRARVDLKGRQILDLAAGTGLDALAIARDARWVTALEPWREMRDVAIQRQRAGGVRNIEFLDGIAEDLSRFPDASFDGAVSIHGAPFPWDVGAACIRGCLRVVEPGGFVVFIATTPGWKKDHEERPLTPTRDPVVEQLAEYGFAQDDVAVEIDYGSVEEAIATYGFIYGEPAIDYLLGRGTAKINWSLRFCQRIA